MIPLSHQMEFTQTAVFYQSGHSCVLNVRGFDSADLTDAIVQKRLGEGLDVSQ